MCTVSNKYRGLPLNRISLNTNFIELTLKKHRISVLEIFFDSFFVLSIQLFFDLTVI